MAPPLHTVTKGPGASPACSSTKCLEACRPSHSAGSEHRPAACRADRRTGRVRKAQEGSLWLVPPPARPEPQGERGWERQDSGNRGLRTWDSSPPSCPSICAANCIHLLPEQPERIKVSHADQHSTSNYEERKHGPCISKESLLAVQTPFLPSLSPSEKRDHQDGAGPGQPSPH